VAGDGAELVFQLPDLGEEVFAIAGRWAHGGSRPGEDGDGGWIAEGGWALVKVGFDFVAVMLDGARGVIDGVEQEDDTRGSRGLAVVDRLKRGEGLRLAVIEEHEVLFPEIGDGLVGGVGDHHFQDDTVLGLVTHFALIAGTRDEGWSRSFGSLWSGRRRLLG